MNNKIILLLILGIMLGGCTSSKYNKEIIDNLANCLVEKNAKEYGAFWCPNCAKQEKMFGSSFKIIKEGSYIECDPRCSVSDIKDLPLACRGVLGETDLCLQKNVEKYPTWEFSSGKVLIGVQEFSVLAREAGCEFNEQN